MTDRELLELAANAASIKKDDSPYNGGGHGNTGFSLNGDMVLDWHNNERWNPLADDGDALRLAVKLNILTYQSGGDSSYASTPMNAVFTVPHDNDPYAATRRAIVRAAAEIGKEMK
jgi:hypothetical protein